MYCSINAPFLTGLQTQALLHDLHMHLTVDENSCPICRHSPIEEYIGLFCAEVPFLKAGSQHHLMAFIHPHSSLQKGVPLDLYEKDMQVIDSSDATMHDKTLMLKFFAPILFAMKNLNATMATSELQIEEGKVSPIGLVCWPQQLFKVCRLNFCIIIFLGQLPCMVSTLLSMILGI